MQAPIHVEGSADDGPSLRLLARHQQRQLTGIPTVSVLLGEISTAKAFWRRWIRADRPALELSSAHPRDLTIASIQALGGTTELPLNASYFLSRWAHRGAASLQTFADRRTPHDLETLTQAAIDAGAPEIAAIAALEICRAEWSSLAPAELAERIEGALAGSSSRPWWRVLGAIDALLPENVLPAILLTAPPAADASSWLADSADPIAHLAQSVPRWSITIAIWRNDFERYGREAPPSRAKSLLESGTISLAIEPLSRSTMAASNAGPVIPYSMKVLEASPSLAKSFEAAKALQPRQDELARSAAERLLFDLLESHPASRGHFVLNGSLGFDFGQRPAEVDLLAAALRLAVEVDGYYHFDDPASYRRDRRKDVELQRHGYLVVRVLAEDVVMRIDDVLDFILAAIDHCRRSTSREDAEP